MYTWHLNTKTFPQFTKKVHMPLPFISEKITRKALKYIFKLYEIIKKNEYLIQHQKHAFSQVFSLYSWFPNENYHFSFNFLRCVGKCCFSLPSNCHFTPSTQQLSNAFLASAMDYSSFCDLVIYDMCDYYHTCITCDYHRITCDVTL